MANVYTYSFEDTTLTINHPDLGSYSAYGTGIGDITVSMADNITSHDVAADLTVIVSKFARKNGTIQMNILQTSDFNTWLKKFYNYVISSDSSKFAQATVILKNMSTGAMYTCTGVSPQKMADDQYQSQAQNRQWTLMAANIEVN